MEYIFYTSDESFDYNGPFGTATHNETGYHGFSLDFDDEYLPILGSINGFGEFDDINWRVKSFKDFENYLKENIPLWKDDVESTPLEAFDELLETIVEINQVKKAS